MVGMLSRSKRHLNVERANEELASSRRGAVYRAIEQLGQGRRGNVFLCDNLDPAKNDHPRRVALRFLPRQAANAATDSLQSEISTHWLLNHHPYVLSFYTILLTPCFIVVVMEYAPGGTLPCYINSLMTQAHALTTKRSSANPSTLSSTHTFEHTDASMASDYSHSGRHSHMTDRATLDRSERKRMAIVRRLFQQLITLLEYVQLCGIALGELQPECFMVTFEGKEGGAPRPSLRLSHFGQHHSEHPTEANVRTPAAESDPDGPFCAVDLFHWTQTHAKPNLAPPPTLDPTRGPHHHDCPHAPHCEHTHATMHAHSGSLESCHSSQSLCGRSAEKQREKCASRMLDVACAGQILFFMIHGYEAFPADGDEMIKSWRSKDASGINWPCRSASKGESGELISWMLQPLGERCSLEEVKEAPFFRYNLPESLLMVTNNACDNEAGPEERADVLSDIRDIVIVSSKPSSR